jgi:hypothetical protein
MTNLLFQRLVWRKTHGLAGPRFLNQIKQRIDVSRQMIYVAMGGLLLKRLFDEY